MRSGQRDNREIEFDGVGVGGRLAPLEEPPSLLGGVTRRVGIGPVGSHVLNMATEAAFVVGALGFYGGSSDVTLGCQIAAGIFAPDAVSSVASTVIRPTLNSMQDGLGDSVARGIHKVASAPLRLINATFSFIGRSAARAISALVGAGGDGRRVYGVDAVEGRGVDNNLNRGDAVAYPTGVRRVMVAGATDPGLTPEPLPLTVQVEQKEDGEEAGVPTVSPVVLPGQVEQVVRSGYGPRAI